MTGRLPPSASVAEPLGGAKLHAPAAERNADHIAALVAAHVTGAGQALEIASGTGQHIIHFAKACPELQWHPTDIAPERLASIDAYVREAALGNVAPARVLDAGQPGWGRRDWTAIVLVNLLHLISDAAAQVVLSEVSGALSPGGTFILYGPFKRGGALTSPGDVRFDAELRGADPAIGYKDDAWVSKTLIGAGLKVETRQMPANNLAFIAQRS